MHIYRDRLYLAVLLYDLSQDYYTVGDIAPLENAFVAT